MYLANDLSVNSSPGKIAQGDYHRSKSHFTSASCSGATADPAVSRHLWPTDRLVLNTHTRAPAHPSTHTHTHTHTPKHTHSKHRVPTHNI